MNTEEFDDIIRNGLKDYEVDLSDMDWGGFKGAMPDDIELDTFDDDIKNSISNYEVPYKPEHWQILKESIVRNQNLRRHIFELKGMELVIAVMFLFLFSSIFNIKSPAVYEDIIKAPSSENFVYSDVEATTAIEDPTDQIVEALQMIDLTKNPIDETTQENLISQSPPLLEEVDNSVFHTITNAKEIIEPTYSKKEAEDPKESIAMLESLPSKNILLAYNSQVDGPQLLDEQENKHSLKITAGPIRNIVHSPFDPVFRTEGYKAYSTNFQISATLQRRWKNIEVLSGFRYLVTKYMPLAISEVYDSGRQGNVQYAQSLTQNKFQTLSIPLGLEYAFINRNKHSVYAMMSGDMNLILSANYAINIFEYGPEPLPLMERSTAIPDSQLDRKSFSPGIIEGGTLRDNSYLSATIGLGYEYEFSSNLSLISEARYQRSILTQGLGPNQDKFHGLSIDLGIKYGF